MNIFIVNLFIFAPLSNLNLRFPPNYKTSITIDILNVNLFRSLYVYDIFYI